MCTQKLFHTIIYNLSTVQYICIFYLQYIVCTVLFLKEALNIFGNVVYYKQKHMQKFLDFFKETFIFPWIHICLYVLFYTNEPRDYTLFTQYCVPVQIISSILLHTAIENIIFLIKFVFGPQFTLQVKPSLKHIRPKNVLYIREDLEVFDKLFLDMRLNA